MASKSLNNFPQSETIKELRAILILVRVTGYACRKKDATLGLDFFCLLG